MSLSKDSDQDRISSSGTLLGVEFDVSLCILNERLSRLDYFMGLTLAGLKIP